jgi:hypothetical protein
MQQAVGVHKDVRRRDSHIFFAIGSQMMSDLTRRLLLTPERSLVLISFTD